MVVAEVLSVAPHPKADRLRVCQVDAGGAASLKVVTNAASVEEGMKVVFAVSAGWLGSAGWQALRSAAQQGQHGGSLRARRRVRRRAWCAASGSSPAEPWMSCSCVCWYTRDDVCKQHASAPKRWR